MKYDLLGGLSLAALLLVSGNVQGQPAAQIFTGSPLAPVSASNPLAITSAGGTIAGTVSISQTTPGTTNGVVVNSGTVAATQSGTWTGITIVPSGTQTVAGTVAATQSGTWTGVTIVPSGTQTVGGQVASGVTAAGNPLADGGRAQNAEATAVTTGQAVEWAFDLVGRGLVFPYANKENIIQGSTTSTGTVAATLIASAGGSLKNYITSLQCFRSDAGTTTAFVTLNDSAATTVVLPVGGGSNITLPLPLATAAATAFTFTPSASLTTVYCSAQGFKGTAIWDDIPAEIRAPNPFDINVGLVG